VIPAGVDVEPRWEWWLAEESRRLSSGRASSGPQPMAATATYQLGAAWLADCASVEDWGCGLGWLRTLIPADRYVGVDGWRTPFADRVENLAGYQSATLGLFMRHVLEHNPGWRQILDNAAASFTHRMALVLFTPMAQTTYVRRWCEETNTPNLSFAHDDIVSRLGPGVRWSADDLQTDTHYGCERIYYLEKPASEADL
jgi:hypothetical protein